MIRGSGSAPVPVAGRHGELGGVGGHARLEQMRPVDEDPLYLAARSKGAASLDQVALV